MYFKFMCAALMCGLAPMTAEGQTYRIDATSPVPAIETGFIKQGANRSPDGHVIGVTSQYLTRDGKPWLPVMGEFHFSRYPANRWGEELDKMKAAGVQIVSSYIFWNHHEEIEGKFDWTGQRDLAQFVRVAKEHGMLVWIRIGPWAHGESRYGGFPDWLVQKVGTLNLRSNDSIYLRYVDRFYAQIATQVLPYQWKSGGPIIGIQFENEYNGRGPGRGEEHVLTLKKLALKHGMDAPLYSLTAWDNAVLPAAEFLPMFGGYPDWPWDQSVEMLPANEVYTFRFANRWAGGMDAEGSTAQKNLTRYPFLGAEYAGGIEDTYHRRPVISANDIAAMLPVQLGSGVNLYGYYMYHGGTNPEGKLTTLNESQRTGYPTDLPVKSYDFQAPLSEFGEMRDSYDKTRLVHYFLNAFGERLAQMTVRAPSVVPANNADTSVLRLSARTNGNSGFIFINNYLRNHTMNARAGVQVELKLPSGTVTVPNKPIAIPANSYMIWPVNLDMGGVTLKYSTAQLITRVGSTWYFLAIPGIKPEFVFQPGKPRPHVVVMTPVQAKRFWPAGRPLARKVVPIAVSARLVKPADSIPPVPLFNAVSWRKVEIALAPSDTAWQKAARWRITLPVGSLRNAHELMLNINYAGDVARLYAGDVLLDDNFFNGTEWRVGMKRFEAQLKKGPLELRVLPLRSDAPIYFDPGYRPTTFPANGQLAKLVRVTATRY